MIRILRKLCLFPPLSLWCQIKRMGEEMMSSPGAKLQVSPPPCFPLPITQSQLLLLLLISLSAILRSYVYLSKLPIVRTEFESMWRTLGFPKRTGRK